MAAVFFRPTNNNSSTAVFKNNMQVNPSISIPALDDMIGESGFLIYSGFSVGSREAIQYFQSFDDFITYFYFGKALGNFSLEGSIFSDCYGNFSSLPVLQDRVARMRGARIYVSFGGIVFTCVLNSSQFNANGEDGNVMNFQLSFDVINNSLRPATFRPAC